MRNYYRSIVALLTCAVLLCAAMPWCMAAVENLLVNGGFESGNVEGWKTWQSTSVSTAAAYEGDYGVHLKGNGGWGALLEQDVTLTVGKDYHLEFWYKVNNNGINWKVV